MDTDRFLQSIHCYVLFVQITEQLELEEVSLA